jgi:hypothetical protein
MASRNDLLNTLCDRRITLGAFNRLKFLHRHDLEIREVQLTVPTLGECFCPWYYVNQGKPEEVDYGTAEWSIAARAMKVNQPGIIDLKSDRRRRIETYRKELKTRVAPEQPILLAIDTRTGKCLILDGNKTSCAIYRNFLDDEAQYGRPVLAIQAAGPYLENIVGDFCIVNRE